MVCLTTSTFTGNCVVPDLAKCPLAVVAHDAGAANLIFSWLKHHRPDGRGVKVFVQGPALRIFSREFPGWLIEKHIDEALNGAACLISGTGWGSDLEHRARILARKNSVPTIAVLDHWVNYPERFERDGASSLPDFFWVFDGYAENLARKCFPGRNISRVNDYYVGDILAGLPCALPEKSADLLYVLEPIRSDWGRDRPGEFQALDYLAANWLRLGIPSDTLWRLRPHPSDFTGKYDQWLAQHPEVNAVVDDSGTLRDALARAKWVAGCETHALTVALAAGRIAVCTLPPWAPACRLPHKALIHLKELAQ